MSKTQKEYQLTPDQLSQIKRRQLANAIKKLESGKSLSKAEQSLIDQSAGPTAADLASAESMEQAASILGLSKKTLSVCKGMGCPAFRGPRVYLQEFRQWWRKNKAIAEPEIAQSESKDEADARVARARANRMEFELEVRRRQFIPAHEVSQVFTRAVVGIKSKMLAIPSSLAPRLALMTNPDDIATLIKSSVVDGLSELSKTKWNKSK